MIIRVGGGSGGLKNYLETGKKVGRELHRDQLDQRVPLFGDLNAFELITSMQKGDGQKYDHFTLAFDENHVSDELLQTAFDRFREHALAAYPENERDGILMYAEAHRPRTLSYTNSRDNTDVNRYIHIHIGIGKKNLKTGKYVEPLGYLGDEADNLKYLDAFQESFNSEFGLASPKDNPRIEPETAVDIYARYTGEKPDALGSLVAKKSALEIKLQKQIIERNITDWSKLGELLGEHGHVSKMKEGKFGECWRVQLPGETKAMRLKGVFFQKQFIERPTVEKVSIFMEKAKTAYLEQMQPRKEPEYVAAVLEEWRNIKCKEIRYINPNNAVYKASTPEQRIEILTQLENKSHGIKSPKVTSVAEQRKRTAEISRRRSSMQGMPMRDMDAIQKRTEMLLPGDHDLDVGAEHKHKQSSPGVRQEVGSDGRSSAVIPIQPSSVLARVQHEQRERYEQAADKERYAEIRQNLECDQLLARLSHSHGLNPALYQVTQGQDGAPRIKCGSRALTPNDFLTKELGLAWKDAAQILRQSYGHQIGKKVTKPRGKADQSPLWAEFKDAQSAGKPAFAEQTKLFDEETKTLRAALSTSLRTEEKQALQGLTGDGRKAAKSLAKFHAAKAKADFSDERRELRKSNQPTQAHAWKLFLWERAQAGHAEALAALRKLDDTARAAPPQSITGTVYLGDDEDEKKRRRLARESARETTAAILKMLNPKVEINGDITYRQNGHAVLRDEGQHLAVLDPESEDAIAAGLLLAKEKFGQRLTLTGSPEFQALVVKVAIEKGIFVKFVDPALEAMHQAAKVKPVVQAPVKHDEHELTVEEIDEILNSPEPGSSVISEEITPEDVGKEIQAIQNMPDPGSPEAEFNERYDIGDITAEDIKAILNTPEPVAQDGLHTGTIQVIENGWAGQQCGRDPSKLVWHEISKLSGPALKKGELAEISRVNGMGTVKVKDINKSTEVGG